MTRDGHRYTTLKHASDVKNYGLNKIHFKKVRCSVSDIEVSAALH